MEVLNQFLPFEPYGKGTETGREVLLAVQFNMFTCGGMAIGVCVSHKIADGTSATTFVKAWADTACGCNTEIVHPSFDAAFHFPQSDMSGFMPTTGITKDNIMSRRFVFDKSSITALKENAKAISADGSSPVTLPTRIEAISAFIWKRFMAIAQSKSVQAKCTPLETFGGSQLHQQPLESKMIIVS
ncbi:hypothetical protein L1049_027404 [Liquidambar formosana]|uniref:BAHD acyltransferase n=1 Tax=Liquidambar formosana TaxID=63359 RepID=A0AAP0RIK8_LIQFO